MYKIAVLVGSLRKESFSRKIAENVVTLFRKVMKLCCRYWESSAV